MTRAEAGASDGATGADGLVAGVVVAHADLARALVEATERISGIRGALHPLSNEACSPEELERRVRKEAADGGAIVFVDLSSGSCALAGRRVGRANSRVAVVSGVNLPMLLDFVFHREMPVDELVRRVVRKGGAGIEIDVSGEMADGPSERHG